MLRLASLREVTWQHPSQWRGRTDDDRPVYIRYKWGELQVYVGAVCGTEDSVLATCPWFEGDVGGPKDSQIDWCDVMTATGIQLTPDLAARLDR